MYSKEEFLKKQSELDSEMAKIWENPFFDGVTNYENYLKAPVKILWILKEPNNSGRNSREGGNQREFHNYIGDYDNWQMTYANIMRVAYGILAGSKNYSEIPPIDKKECVIKDENGDEWPVFDEIAIINVKKSGGGSVTDKKSLEIEYKREGVKEFLFKQIEFINPEIIINSHGVYEFYNDQIYNEEMGFAPEVGSSENEVRFSENKNRLIIWTRHPNRAEAKSYCNNILDIVNSWNKEGEKQNGFFPNRPEKLKQFTKEELEALTERELIEKFLELQDAIGHFIKIIDLQEEINAIHMKVFSIIGRAFGRGTHIINEIK